MESDMPMWMSIEPGGVRGGIWEAKGMPITTDSLNADSLGESRCAEEDRKERRRKLGLPEELTEAEKEAERARLAESAKAKPTIGLPVKPISLLAQMREVLVRSPFFHVALQQGMPLILHALGVLLS